MLRHMTLLIIALLISLPALSEPIPIEVYDEKIGFDVVRNGELVGQHMTKFSSEDSKLVVESQMNMSITFLSIPIYTFNYRSIEKWSDETLIYLDVVVNDGADETKIYSLESSEGLMINAPSGTYRIDTPIISSNHWNADVVKQSRVLNTLTGNINQVKILNKGIQKIVIKEGSVLATRYDYIGELTDTSVWYDSKGRWSKLEFKARDGSTIEYICNTCENQP